MSTTLSMRSLLGHRQVDVALQCLGSLRDHCRDPLTLTLHDDGTLTSQDVERLQAALHPVTMLSRAEADEHVEPQLRLYPHCRAFRQAHPLALKLLDVTLLQAAESSTLAFCDSDILFLRPFVGFEQQLQPGIGCVFMQDRQEAYALRPWRITPLGHIRIPRHINTGLILHNTKMFDIDFIEYLLKSKAIAEMAQKRPVWVEQTCWAALGARVGCRIFEPDQFIVATKKMQVISPKCYRNSFCVSSQASTSRVLAGCETWAGVGIGTTERWHSFTCRFARFSCVEFSFHVFFGCWQHWAQVRTKGLNVSRV